MLSWLFNVDVTVEVVCVTLGVGDDCTNLIGTCIEFNVGLGLFAVEIPIDGLGGALKVLDTQIYILCRIVVGVHLKSRTGREEVVEGGEIELEGGLGLTVGIDGGVILGAGGQGVEYGVFVVGSELLNLTGALIGVGHLPGCGLFFGGLPVDDGVILTGGHNEVLEVGGEVHNGVPNASFSLPLNVFSSRFAFEFSTFFASNLALTACIRVEYLSLANLCSCLYLI